MIWLPELEHINTAEFSREAQHFIKYGYYTNAPRGTRDYIEYWEEQKRRRVEGYTVGGVRITGKHYGYLNFSQILLQEEDSTGKRRKKKGFPRFYDGDYHYFHGLEKARLEGKGMIVAKARRKGFSYKNAWVIADEFNLVRDSISVVGAYMDDFADNTVGMAIEYLDFLNKHTAWKRQRNPNRRDFMKSQFLEYVDGYPVYSGYKSEIHKVSFKDDPFKSIGKSCSIFLFEEAGKWPGLIKSYRFSEPTWKDGDILTGMPIIFGTGGDMEKGTAEFHNMFYHPEAYNLMPFENIWDENKLGTVCGYFYPDYIAKPPYIDDNGNSLVEEAKAKELLQRAFIAEKSKRKGDLDDYISQNPFSPQEAFMVRKGNIFPSGLLARQLAKIEGTKDLKFLGDRGFFDYDDAGVVKFNINQNLKPVDFPLEKDNVEGCVQIWEHPRESEKSPYGLFFATLDPYDHDKSESGSIGSMIIWKTVADAGQTYDLPVASYHGRPEKANEFYENCRRLQKYYNAVCLYENEKIGYEKYLENKGESYLLKDQPSVLDKILKQTHVKRPKGTHMVIGIKDQCEIWAKDWLLEETAPGHFNTEKIFDTFLLKQLIAYDPDGNFDSVIAFLLAMLYKQEVHNVINTAKDKKDYIDPFFSKTSIFRK